MIQINGFLSIYFEVALLYDIVLLAPSPPLLYPYGMVLLPLDHGVVTSDDIGRFSATIRSYAEQCIWACSCQ
jgi:hypothetical protein